jgi:hypothetical protein
MLHAGRAKIVEAKLDQTRAFFRRVGEPEIEWLRKQDPAVIAGVTRRLNELSQRFGELAIAVSEREVV